MLIHVSSVPFVQDWPAALLNGLSDKGPFLDLKYQWMKVDETDWKHELDWNVDGLVQVERC